MIRLPSLLAALVAGLATAPFFTPQALPTFVPWLAAISWLLLRKNTWAKLLLILFFCTLGFSLYHVRSLPPSSTGHIAAFISKELLVVEGTIDSVTLRPLGQSYLDIDAQRVAAAGIAAPVAGRMRLFVAEGEPLLQAGHRVRFMTRLRHPRAFGTPGEFNYPRHLAARNIFVTGSIATANDLTPLASEKTLGWGEQLEQLRQNIGRQIDQLVPPMIAPLVRALTIGDKSTIPHNTRQLLADAGVSHLFAISGLHLGLIALMLYAGARLLYRCSESMLLHGPPGRYLPALLLPALLFYLFFTGAAIPTQRAFLAALCTALLLLLGRGTPPLRLLTSAAFCLLLINPLYFFEPSFQLSFAGVAGILILLPRLLLKLPTARPIRWPLVLACTTLAATLATAPVALLHFHLLAPAGLLTNLFAVPAIGFGAVPLGLMGVLLLDIWPEAAQSCLWLCTFILEQTLNLLSHIIQWPLLAPSRPYLSQWQWSAVAVCCWGLLVPAAKRGRYWPHTVLMTIAVLALLYPCMGNNSGLTVTALSVGQGDSTLLTLADRHYLVDGGGLRSETFDVGERLVAPALGRLGVHRLEAVVLTHDHPDHRDGLLHVLAHFPVRAFWSAAPVDELDPELQKVLSDRQIPVRIFLPGWTSLADTSNITLQAFVPEIGTNLNDLSMVLYVRLEGQGVLLTGDLERIGVGELLDAVPNGPVTLLKLPHHGSRYSDPQKLLDFFSPKVTFVSSGFGNVHRLPHKEVVVAVEQRSLPLFRTDLHGTVRFQTNGDEWRISRWQRGLFR
jgi:competence protein ComEC